MAASLTPEQCRAARGLLDWTQRDLAKASGITRHTITRFEGSKHVPHPANRALLREVFEAAGIAFIEPGETGVGVCFREP